MIYLHQHYSGFYLLTSQPISGRVKLFASYLGISRSALSLIELRKRSLPTPALVKLDTLLLVLRSTNLLPSPKAMDTLNSQQQKHRTLANKRIAKIEHQLAQLQQQLDAMKLEYKQCMKALESAAYILARLTNTAADKMDKETMQLLELQTLKKTRACGTGAQALLALRIKLLNHEAGLLAKLAF